jgi:low affinity Fe/Cu permease
MTTRKRSAMGRFRFSDFARRLAVLTGRPAAFVAAVGAVLAWALLGPLFGFSDTWQLVVNTATTIVTFVMVFLIQNTQNRDTEAIQIKLDALLNLEHLEDEELERYRRHYAELARKARQKIRAGELDTDAPEIKAFAKR